MDTNALPEHGRDRIRHVIVLMMENRSFDHLLGFLRPDDPAYPGAVGHDCPTDPENPRRDLVHTSPDASEVLGVDPDHSHESVMFQMFGTRNPPNYNNPSMTGFVRSYADQIGDTDPAPPEPRDVMRCFSTSNAPVISQLANNFAVLSNWRASVPGETWPNRNYAHAATSDGTANIRARFYGNRTVFQVLAAEETDGKPSWGIYHDGVAQVWAFWKLWARRRNRFHDMNTLFDDIEHDRLPKYSFVEPNHGYGKGEGNSQHPGNNTTAGDSFVGGERLMAEIYNALANKPEVFAKTLFLITYDEHGGFFDHVPPHPMVPPDDKKAPSGFDFSLSGVRVPAVAISPLIPQGTVDDTLYDHASIPKTVRMQFAKQAAELNPREDAANDVLANLSLLPVARTDCAPVTPPEPAFQVAEAAIPTILNGFEASLLELAGAVRNHLGLPAEPEALTEPPPFDPGPTLTAAAEARVMNPAASREVDEAVAMFRESPAKPDPANPQNGGVR
jgi:phospholipase C